MSRQPIGRLGVFGADGVADLGRPAIPSVSRGMMPVWRVGIHRRPQDMDTL
ncbi:hypothetical protein BJ993_000654 [Nocardioides aromaticivorans]|uniref:Uncharacterized protein n=1 Tax=Nocardioides aromaticivorans TaxID=200618 RepID=A0A7Z0CJY0_9ACTN|nr:hypothetical protein [Nocardioides aromaticivorans]